uniref:Thioredoxin domain-containing protein n=1 Tax=Heterorhabditis bacteriophora TaxID=37862 RepID=A0A1I7WL24_HETBA
MNIIIIALPPPIFQMLLYYRWHIYVESFVYRTMLHGLPLLGILAASCLLLSEANKFTDVKEIYSNPLSHGFGEDIDWVPWEDAIEKALDNNKPIFLLIHKTWCHACKALKKTFQQSNARKAFKTLSQYFIMVNTEDDEEPFEEEYRPDGKYIPRLLFLGIDLSKRLVNFIVKMMVNSGCYSKHRCLLFLCLEIFAFPIKIKTEICSLNSRIKKRNTKTICKMKKIKKIISQSSGY